jgi:hypothetical protein
VARDLSLSDPFHQLTVRDQRLLEAAFDRQWSPTTRRYEYVLNPAASTRAILAAMPVIRILDRRWLDASQPPGLPSEEAWRVWELRQDDPTRHTYEFLGHRFGISKQRAHRLVRRVDAFRTCVDVQTFMFWRALRGGRDPADWR